MKATITSKGQITIPVRVRRRLGLKPGDVLDFDENAECLLARPAFDAEKMRAASDTVNKAVPANTLFPTSSSPPMP